MLKIRLFLPVLVLIAAILPGRVQAQLDEEGARLATTTVNEFAKVWHEWEPIPNMNPIAFGRAADGNPVAIGTVRGVHIGPKDNHTDVHLVYPFDSKELAYVYVESSRFTVFALPNGDGTFTVIQDGDLTASVNESGEAESFTITYTLVDGRERTKTYHRSKTVPEKK